MGETKKSKKKLGRRPVDPSRRRSAAIRVACSESFKAETEELADWVGHSGSQ